MSIIDALIINDYITSIYLSSNQITDTGANKISEALKFTKSITKLSLSSNPITDIGAKSIIEAVIFNGRRISVYFYDNKISSNLISSAAEGN